MTARAYLIGRGSRFVSVTETRNDRVTHYVVGFGRAVLARHVQYFMHPEPVLSLERAQVRQATLHVPKAPADLDGGPLNPLLDGGFHLHTMALDALLALPLQRGVGLVLPSRIDAETDGTIILACSVVDPCADPEGARRALEW